MLTANSRTAKVSAQQVGSYYLIILTSTWIFCNCCNSQMVKLHEARFIILAVYGVALPRYDSKVYWICDQSQHVSVARVTEGGAAAVSWQTHADTSPRTVSAEITSSGNLTPANTWFFPFKKTRAFLFLFFEK